MNIAYLISAHTDPPQLKQLIEALDYEDCMFFVHIDKKTDIRKFKNLFKQKNVEFVYDRTRIYWGTYSQVEYQMKLIRAALSSGKTFDKLFMLSGQDYPLWSNHKICEWVAATTDRDIISAICLDSDDIAEKDKQIYRMNRPQSDIPWTGYRMNDLASKALRKTLMMMGSKKPLQFNVGDEQWHLYKGSSYFALSHDTAKYAYIQWREHKEISDYFKSSFSPSETCIHTILFNNPEYRLKSDLHTGSFQSLQALTPLHHIEYDPVIKVWTDRDLDELVMSGKMFAQKFETGKSDKLIEKIKELRR